MGIRKFRDAYHIRTAGCRTLRTRVQRSLRLECLEARTLLTAGLLDMEGFVAAQTANPWDGSETLAAAVAEPDLARVRGRLTENTPPSEDGPTNRSEVTEAQPGDVFLLEVLLQDIRQDDGAGGSNQFGIFASYMNIGYDPEAFVIPSGSPVIPPHLPQLSFPISFQNAYIGVRIDTGSFLGERPDYEYFRYVNGPAGDAETPGLVRNVGSFLQGLSPPGRSELFQFDMPFEVQSFVARDDTAQVWLNGSVRIPVLENDTVISGDYTFELTQPSSGEVYDFLLFGETGRGSVVPPEQIDFVSPTLNVTNDAVLQIVEVSQGQKGSVTINQDGTVTYMPHVTEPGTDTFTYTVTDGNGNSQSATVQVDIQEPVMFDLAGRVSSNGSWWVAESGGGEFSNQAWGRWSADVDWQYIEVGDFTGNGYDDIVGWNANGDWWIARSQGDRFVNERWGRWNPAAGWTDVAVGDFTGDGRADLVGRTSSGEWWIARSTGNSFVNERWGRWSIDVDWTDIQVGDFTGNGRADLVGRNSDTGEWWLAESNGSGFVNQRWGRWSTAVDWSEIRVGDFTGNGRDDLVGRVAHSGEWWLAKATDSGFVNQRWGRWSVNVDWEHVQVGDFTGDGKADLVGRNSANGGWWLAESNGGGFVNQRWGRWATHVDWAHVQSGDFNGDGKADLVGWDSATGYWWIARSTGTRFMNEQWGRWSTNVVWDQVLVGNFATPPESFDALTAPLGPMDAGPTTTSMSPAEGEAGSTVPMAAKVSEDLHPLDQPRQAAEIAKEDVGPRGPHQDRLPSLAELDRLIDALVGPRWADSQVDAFFATL